MNQTRKLPCHRGHLNLRPIGSAFHKKDIEKELMHSRTNEYMTTLAENSSHMPKDVSREILKQRSSKKNTSATRPESEGKETRRLKLRSATWEADGLRSSSDQRWEDCDRAEPGVLPSIESRHRRSSIRVCPSGSH